METEVKILKFKQNRYHILSGNAIKIIGILLMVMDHLHQMFISQGAPYWFNWFGRPVAAMFLFLCAEGFYFTRDRRIYMIRLLAGFFLMSIMNRVFNRYMPLEEVTLINNIFSTLFVAAFYMGLFDLVKKGITEKKAGKVFLAIGVFLLSLLIGLALLIALTKENVTAAAVLLFIPNPISAEGGFPLILLGLLFYILRKYRLAQAALVLAFGLLSWLTTHSAQWLMVFAVIPILLYNGQRGRGSKYFFYIFYPAHIYIFYVIAWFLGQAS
ncbi:MAG: conjugal transfer protein TraX [Treponema sp.]|jgi:hypothetical protein|nr:conjugal transfer protein TraX [Treponema sp.]